MPTHKNKAITYITEEQRLAAVKQQDLVLRGKGRMFRTAGIDHGAAKSRKRTNPADIDD